MEVGLVKNKKLVACLIIENWDSVRKFYTAFKDKTFIFDVVVSPVKYMSGNKNGKFYYSCIKNCLENDILKVKKYEYIYG